MLPFAGIGIGLGKLLAGFGITAGQAALAGGAAIVGAKLFSDEKKIRQANEESMNQMMRSYMLKKEQSERELQQQTIQSTRELTKVGTRRRAPPAILSPFESFLLGNKGQF